MGARGLGRKREGEGRGGLQYKVCQNPDPLPSEANKLFMPALNSGRAPTLYLFWAFQVGKRELMP